MTTGSNYLDSIKTGAIQSWHEHKVLPSLIGAQAALESGWGTSSLAKPPYNNQFGIKASDDWTGRTVLMPTKEWNGSSFITVTASFRAYDNINDSVKDHGAFFSNTPWRKENYKFVVGEKDYIKGARALQSSGYATDPGYANKLIGIIEDYKLNFWDQEALNGTTTSTQSPTTLQPVSKVVGGELTDAAKTYLLNNSSVTVIGDSLGVGTEPHLKKLIPDSNYNVAGSRQITHSDSNLNGTLQLENMKNAGTLKQSIVVILGTNRGLTTSEIDEFMRIAGPERKVLWVETNSKVNHMNSVNDEINKASRRHSNAFALEWSKVAGPMFSQWYSSDNIHMIPLGYQKHAEYIAQGVYEMELKNTDTRSAETVKTEYEGIIGYKLFEDGRVEYKDSTGKTKTEETDLKGLSTDGITNYIYNVEANNKWNPQNDNLEADWIDGKFEDSELSGLELLKSAGNEMMMRGEPETKYRVKLSRMPYNIAIGSEGMFLDHESNPPLYIRARVLEIVTSDTNPEDDEAVIGNVVELQPLEKRETLKIQRELIKAREEILRGLRDKENIQAEIISTGPTIFGYGNSQTQLILKVYKGTEDVTEQFNDFKWFRSSLDTAKDNEYNTVLSQTETSNTLIVKTEDIQYDESTFIGRVYDDAGNLVKQADIKLKVAVTSLWVDEPTPPPVAQDGAKWVNPTTGEQKVKINGNWEDVVDQQKVSEIVRKDGVTVSFSDTQPSNGGKSGDIWFKLNEDGTQSIMRHNGTEFVETVTNALNADGLVEGTIDASEIAVINLNAANITAGHGDFITIALQAINSRLTLDGTAIRILNEDGTFIEMNNVPEIRSTAPNGTSVILGDGRVHFYDNVGNSKGYVGTDMHGGTRDFGTFLSKGSGVYRFARMADINAVEAKYYTVEPGDYRVRIIEKLVARGLLPDGDAADFVRKSNEIAKLNGWAPLPQDWPSLSVGQQIKYVEAKVTGENKYYTVQSGQGWNAIALAAGVPLQQILDLNNLTIDDIVHPGDILLVEIGTGEVNGEAYEDIWKFGPSSQGDWRVYFNKYATFEAGTNISSDRRIKENIEDTDIVALDEIKKLVFKQFDKINTGKHTDIGLIAQDSGVLRVIDEIEGIDLEGSIMLALKGIQELNAKLDRIIEQGGSK